MIVPKHLVWAQNNDSLTLKDMLNHSFLNSDEYNKAGVNIINLNDTEILDACKEFLTRVNHRFVSNLEDQNIVKKIENHFRKRENFDYQFGFFHPHFTFGMNWIRSKGPEFLE
jgi:hypothetical protein